MNNLIIKKWIEPYRLLETVKKYCQLTDLTFDGMNKLEQKNNMFSLCDEQEKFIFVRCGFIPFQRYWRCIRSRTDETRCGRTETVLKDGQEAGQSCTRR